MASEEVLTNIESALDDIYKYLGKRMDETFDRQEKLRKLDDPDDGFDIGYCEGAMDEQEEIMKLIDIMKSKIHSEIIGFGIK